MKYLSSCPISGLGYPASMPQVMGGTNKTILGTSMDSPAEFLTCGTSGLRNKPELNLQQPTRVAPWGNRSVRSSVSSLPWMAQRSWLQNVCDHLHLPRSINLHSAGSGPESSLLQGESEWIKKKSRLDKSVYIQQVLKAMNLDF